MKFLLVLSAALAAAYGEASEPRAQLRPITYYYAPALPAGGLYGAPLYVPEYIDPLSEQPGMKPYEPITGSRPKGVVRGPQGWGQPSITVPEQGTENIIGQLAPAEQGFIKDTISPETIITQVAPSDCPWCRGGGTIKGVVRGAGGTLIGPMVSGPQLSDGPQRFPATIDATQAWESRPPPEDSFGKLTEQSNKKGVVRGTRPLPSPPASQYPWSGALPGAQRGRPVAQSVPMVPASSTVCLNYMGAAVPCANGMPMPVDQQPSKLGVVRRPQHTIKIPAQRFRPVIHTPARPDEALKTWAPPHSKIPEFVRPAGPTIGSGAIVIGDQRTQTDTM